LLFSFIFEQYSLYKRFSPRSSFRNSRQTSQLASFRV
jgi:hypothetical protein